MKKKFMKGLGSKISSLFSFKKFKFDRELYKTLSPQEKWSYLSENRNKLNIRLYELELQNLQFEFDNKVKELNEKSEIENKNNKYTYEYSVKDFVITKQYKVKAMSLLDSPKGRGLSHPPPPAHPKGFVWDMSYAKRQDHELRERERRLKILQEERKFKFNTRDIKDRFVFLNEGEEEEMIVDMEVYAFTNPDVHEVYKQAKRDSIAKQNRIDEMNEGCILCITDTGAYCSPLIEKCSPRDEDTFRYRMIINRMSKVQTVNEFKETLIHMFPFITEGSITFDNKVEDYFPFNLREINYYNRFSAKWFFIKNVSQDSVMVYLRNHKGEGYNDRDFVVVKPGGIISLLYGNMINCGGYTENNRLPDDHEYMKQYKDKTHPLIVT